MPRYLTLSLVGFLSLLWVAELVLWVRSGWVGDAWTWERVHLVQLKALTHTVKHEELELTLCSDGDGLALSYIRVNDHRAGNWPDPSEVSTTLRTSVLPDHESTANTPRLSEKIWQKRLGPRRFGTFSNHWTSGAHEMRHVGLVLPHFVLLSLLTLAWGWSYGKTTTAAAARAAARRRRGLCGCCGYDVRASVERCPECGKPL